jgi:predicted N-formylglutamate amidohydrolase
MSKALNTLQAEEEPDPFELINPEGHSELVLICDHVGNRVPA